MIATADHATLMTDSTFKTPRGRGTASTVDGRYLEFNREAMEDGWFRESEDCVAVTSVTVEKPRTIISRNRSPDIPFEQSINPYRGCEHGCIYCYARPTHAYLDLSPGIDFETRLFAKDNAAELLRGELARSGYRCRTIAMGTNTDPYQPVERERRITRRIIEVLWECRHPLTIVTKSRLVERDIDLLAPMAVEGLVKIFLTVTTLNNDLARRLEPRAGVPRRRVECMRRLHEAGIPVGVLVAPVIPYLNDTEMESILEVSSRAGAETAAYIMLRLPHEIKTLFQEWLQLHVPLKADHVMSMIRDIRGGKDNDPNFFSRHSGRGVYADMIRKRFEHQCKRLGLNGLDRRLDTEKFVKPRQQTGQLDLF